MLNRLLSLAITRLVIAAVLFFGLWKLGAVAVSVALGRTPAGIIDRTMAALAAITAFAIVGGFIERRSVADLGF
jgi:hypothetical protein